MQEQQLRAAVLKVGPRATVSWGLWEEALPQRPGIGHQVLQRPTAGLRASLVPPSTFQHDWTGSCPRTALTAAPAMDTPQPPLTHTDTDTHAPRLTYACVLTCTHSLFLIFKNTFY